MNAQPLVVRTEIAADLVVDHLDVILALQNSPLTKSDVVTRLGSEATFNRLVRHGLLVEENHLCRAVSDVYQQARQEGMMSFLSRCVLPAITASIESDAHVPTQLATRYLHLSDSQIRGLRAGWVTDFFSELTAISEEPQQGPTAQLKFVVVGTSDVLPETLPQDEAVLIHLQRASVQRATANLRDLAMLTQINFLACHARYAKAQQALATFLARLDTQASENPTHASYFLTVASHWQIAHAAGFAQHEEKAELRQSC